MVEILFNQPHLLHQTPDNADDMAELPIAACVDATPIIVISQEGRSICINRKSVPELCKLLKKLAR